MQLITRPALRDLAIFIAEPSVRNASRVVSIPVLYDILKHEEQNGQYPATIRQVCKWLHDRAALVLQLLIIHGIPPSDPTAVEMGGDWRKV
jgi:hypothetical protein